MAAAFARTDSTILAVHTSTFPVALNVLWLVFHWRLAERAGFACGWRERTGEALWLCAGERRRGARGPETAMLASYGPLIVLRYVVDERPSWADLARTAHRIAPFAAPTRPNETPRSPISALGVCPLPSRMNGWSRA